jgi:hypothetical protein
MRLILSLSFFLITFISSAQADTARRLRGFPITDYIVELNDSTRLVQLDLPAGLTIPEKQLGILRGIYDGTNYDTAMKGYGRCHLIKGNFYYFTIGHNNSGYPIKAGDLLYTFMPAAAIYNGKIPLLADFFIELQNVYEIPFYDRYLIFRDWTSGDERNAIDSMTADIRFTGNYFTQNNPSMDKPIHSGDFKGQKVLGVMTGCTSSTVEQFLEYIIARPRLYAGKKWKISEIFATWLMNGAPTVKK